MKTPHSFRTPSLWQNWWIGIAISVLAWFSVFHLTLPTAWSQTSSGEHVIIETDLDSKGAPSEEATVHTLRPLPKAWQFQGMLAALKDDIPEVQAEALYRLLEFDAFSHIPDSSISTIAGLIHHESLDVRLPAIKALGKIGPPAARHSPELAALLKHEDARIRAAAAAALGTIGDSAQAYTSELVDLLRDEDIRVQAAAAETLNTLNRLTESYLLPLVALLTHSQWEVRAATATLIGNLEETARSSLPEILQLLHGTDWETRTAAVMALGNLGEIAKDTIPEIARLLKDESWSVRAASARALGKMKVSARPYLPHIASLLRDENKNVRAAAAWALGNLEHEAIQYVPRLLNRLNDPEASVRAAAIEAVGAINPEPQNYLSDVIDLLNDSGWEVRAAAARTLGDMDKIGQSAIAELTALINDQDWFVRSAAARALGNLETAARPSLPELASLLQDRNGNVRSAAVWALGNIGEEASAYRSQLISLLEDDHVGVRYAAFRALSNMGTMEVHPIIPLVNPIYKDPSRAVEIRSLAHFVGAGDDEVETLLTWLGEPGPNYPEVEELTQEEAREALHLFDMIWDSARQFKALVTDITEQIAVVVREQRAEWTQDDLPLLRSHLNHLKSVESPHAGLLQDIISALEGQIRMAQFIKICLFHPLLWLTLLLLYPFSGLIRKIFFWNPYIRLIAGLGYVHLTLLWIPPLRRYLFRPYRQALLADARLEMFEAHPYFDGSDVQVKATQEILPLHQALPGLKGQILLEGESGLGKTMFMRSLLWRSRRPAVFLPAQRCSRGVIEGVQRKLNQEAKDVKFLKRLIAKGALDMYLDGLNEVKTDTRSHIMRFVEAHRKGRLLVTTQPLDWTAPSTMSVYILRALRQEQIEAYLQLTHAILPPHLSIDPTEYEQACQGYLAEVLNPNQPKAILEAITYILSNPVNLNLVALLGAYGQEPQLFHLQEQYYHLMTATYSQERPGNTFPLAQFTEWLYQMRLKNGAILPDNGFLEIIRYMERYHMAIIHHMPVKSSHVMWSFYHESIMDFFIAHTFMGTGNQRPAQYFRDPRFRGVYCALAFLLPLQEALEFREKLLHYAAEVGELGIGALFVQLHRIICIRERLETAP